MQESLKECLKSKKDIDTEGNYLLSKVKKFELNPNAPQIKRKYRVRWKVMRGLCLKHRPMH